MFSESYVSNGFNLNPLRIIFADLIHIQKEMRNSVPHWLKSSSAKMSLKLDTSSLSLINLYSNTETPSRTLTLTEQGEQSQGHKISTSAHCTPHNKIRGAAATNITRVTLAMHAQLRSACLPASPLRGCQPQSLPTATAKHPLGSCNQTTATPHAHQGHVLCATSCY